MKPFDNPKVREAVARMVDKPAFADIATFGHATPIVAPIPPTHPYFRKDLLTAQNIPTARKLLAEAGYSNSFVIDLSIPGQSPGIERLATAFRDVAKQVGITVNLGIIPQDKFFAEMELTNPLIFIS
jgi:peptide/nickel transport system substrate-binding protein